MTSGANIYDQGNDALAGLLGGDLYDSGMEVAPSTTNELYDNGLETPVGGSDALYDMGSNVSVPVTRPGRASITPLDPRGGVMINAVYEPSAGLGPALVSPEDLGLRSHSGRRFVPRNVQRITSEASNGYLSVTADED